MDGALLAAFPTTNPPVLSRETTLVTPVLRFLTYTCPAVTEGTVGAKRLVACETKVTVLPSALIDGSVLPALPSTTLALLFLDTRLV
jgi:hypothetical protein